MAQFQAPTIMFNHFYDKNDWRATSTVVYQSAQQRNSRLGNYNAPNPSPVYYRNLPSFYINNPNGSNFEAAHLAKEAFVRDGQLNWEAIVSYQ